MNFTILITAPSVYAQGAYTAYQFCKAALASNHSIEQIFFYGEGVYNANALATPPSDEPNLVKLWQTLAQRYHVKLCVCVDAAQKRGILDKEAAEEHSLNANLAEHFSVTSLSQLIEAIGAAERVITFN